MDVVLLSRIQFAITIGFHYIFPPLTIGLAMLLVAMEARYLATRNPLYEQLVRFWVKIFGLIFSIGVASGIVMEFQFGTNWANYSRFVGDVFGSPLAAEGIFAFFLESTFLGVLIFGWDRVSPRMHFISTCMVALGSTLSAFWIVAANSWMQTPAGYHIVHGPHGTRAEIVDFMVMVFNPTSIDRFIHVILGCWQSGAWLVISVGAFYLLKKRHEDFAKASIKFGLVLALVSSLLQLGSGHSSAIKVSRYQPAKLAAMEGHFAVNEAAPLNLLGWVDQKREKTLWAVGIPGGLSFLVSGKFDTPIRGLTSFPKNEWPPVNAVFQVYHGMIAIGMTLIGLSSLGVFLWWRGWLFRFRALFYLFIPVVVLPELANQLGWMTAEIGRQPWLVYGLLKTSQGVSRVVSGAEVLASIAMFSTIYLLLGALFIFLLFHKIQHGPETQKGEV